jgi:hypothetical protein
MSSSPPPHRIQFHVDPIFHNEIARLPWRVPISEWHKYGVRPLNIHRGISRHVVIFVRAGRFTFGIKEISEEISKKEISNYEKLLLRGIHTLIPVGYVVREEEPVAVRTPVGVHYQAGNISHTITLLVEKVLPDSQLYARGFSFDNRKRIWDAIAELFVELHTNGVYWGDASLANTLIRFEKVDEPFVGKKTTLKAYLADAETVEFRPSVSKAMREAELNFFFESMEWMNEDLRAAGSTRDELATANDQQYLRGRYSMLSAVEEKKKEFERLTSYNIDRFLGQIHNPSYVDLFMKHIEEHKWYLGERSSAPVSLKEAAHDWYEYMYKPVCELFRREEIVDLFPGKTAAELYIEIMTNKYFLSEKIGKDVGMIQAMHDYAEKFGVTNSFLERMKSASDKLLSIFTSKR